MLVVRAPPRDGEHSKHYTEAPPAVRHEVVMKKLRKCAGLFNIGPTGDESLVTVGWFFARGSFDTAENELSNICQ